MTDGKTEGGFDLKNSDTTDKSDSVIRARRLLRRKFLIAIGAVSAIVMMAFMFDIYAYLLKRDHDIADSGSVAINQIKSKLDSLVGGVMHSANQFTEGLDTGHASKQDILDAIKKESISNELVLGISVAYKPYGFSDSVRLYAPFYDNRQGTFLFIQDAYDYTDTTLEKANWYTEVIANEKPVWSEPYFSDVAQLSVTDYCVPVFRSTEGKKELVGVVAYMISLNRLSKFIDMVSVGTSGFVYMASSKGTIISHIDYGLVLNSTVTDLYKAEGHEDEAVLVTNQEHGYFKHINQNTGANSYSFFNSVNNSDWKIVLVSATNDILGAPILLGNKIVNLALSGSFLILVWLAVMIHINEDTQTKLWIISTVLSFLLAFNIAVVWWLNLNMDYGNDENQSTKITSFPQLQKFILDENLPLRQLGYDEYIPIKTGIYFDNVEFNDSYTISVRGRIWQFWPVGHELQPDFQFLQQSPRYELSKKLLSVKKTPKGDEMMYTWQFASKIRIPLKYTKYPFDSRDIKIEIAYTDMQTGIMLVPDLEGYPIMDPSTFPGINPNNFFPQVEMTSSFFSFEPVVYKTTFGNRARSGDDVYKVMAFNILSQRRFINAFVVNIIPIIVVATMIFLIFYSNSRKKDDNSGISMMGVIQSCAGFFFVLLLAHINLRQRLATPEISYIETFYFTMYVMIALLAVNIVAFTKVKKSRFLHYEDNLLVKLLFWPLLLGSWLVITLNHFYH